MRGGEEIEWCPHCKGVWFDQMELPEYLNGETRNDQEEGESYKPLRLERSPKLGFCPKCNHIFTGKTIGTSGVRLSRCVNCRGLWVQDRQLRQLISWYRAATPAEQLLAEDFTRKDGRIIAEGNFGYALLGLVADENPTVKSPWATFTLVLTNVAVFGWFMLSPEGMESYMMTPERLVNAPLRAFYTLMTSMFLHANFSHILGNMYFLYVFGDNIEDRAGVTTYLVLYLTSGIVAGLLHALLTSHPEIPVLGASGAVSGVIGGYVVLFPKATIRSHKMIVGAPFVLRLSARFYIGSWFIWQFVGVALSFPGVAWDAHISGFLFGAATMFLMRRLNPV
jgi:membrane associated rhomboid family serine protease